MGGGLVAKGEKNIATNRKAYHEYFIEETYEAGISLYGTEVKSIRMGRINLRESYVFIEGMQAMLIGCHISPYDKGNIYNKDPVRPRRLLLHKREIRKLFEAVSRGGYTIVPTRVYLKNGRVKLEIGLARGKKLYDKRDAAAEKDAKREMERTIRERNR